MAVQQVEETRGVGDKGAGPLEWITGTLVKAGSQVTFAGPNGDVPLQVVDKTVAAKALEGLADGKYNGARIGGYRPGAKDQDQRFQVTQLCAGTLEVPPPPPPVSHRPAPGYGAPGVYVVEVPGYMYVPRPTRRC